MEEKSFLDVLRLVAPGTALRAALEDIVRAKTGALIVIDADGLQDILEKGFRINSKFTPQRLVELCKMDGAVVLSRDMKKILYANTILVPDKNIATAETGTRHRAAERTAKQVGTLVIAVSERRNVVTLYYQDMKYVLRSTEEILRRATETLQILEKQREIYNDLVTNLNVLEITGLVSVADVCAVLARIEMIKKIAASMKFYMIELGNEGTIVRMRFRELMSGLDSEQKLLLEDYSLKHLGKIGLKFEEIIDINQLASKVFGRSPEEIVQPKGYRLLSKTKLEKRLIKLLVSRYKNLGNILNSDLSFFGKEANKIQKELANLREQVMVGKKV